MQKKTLALPVFTLLALYGQHAWAGGIMLYEIGTDNAGLANAGAAARAQGPSTIASNPAVVPSWGFGANVGVIFAPQPGTRIGLAYTRQVDLDFKDKPYVKGDGRLLERVNNTNTELDTKVPQTVTLSLFQQLDPQWALLASANWQDWSEFGDIGVQVDTTALGSQSRSVDAGFKDTWHLSLGAQYQATQQLLWNAGVAYDSSAVSDSDRSVIVPMNESWRIATGATYALNKDTDVNVSWAMVWLGDMPVQQTKASGNQLSGQFDNAWIQALTGNMTWRL
ncbi:OmpP1/FadL family transporter [Pseudomonas sp. Irchel s3f7]|uniref:OmpP1/FadL family transporter n=1 Tax=Pseudomonas sp. Irchel s3f7 TaxID=2009153 RepID=UPI000BA35387|nr:outer membrane protein transport protein [Pseudomonas sp. Irchel s3f7]